MQSSPGLDWNDLVLKQWRFLKLNHWEKISYPVEDCTGPGKSNPKTRNHYGFLIIGIHDLSIEIFRRSTSNLQEALKAKVLAVTSDNEKEFTEYESFAQNLKVQFFLDHPYASWKRWLS